MIRRLACAALIALCLSLIGCASRKAEAETQKLNTAVAVSAPVF